MAELRFDGRVAVVTGAGGGLGREHALLLAARGAQVVVNDAGGAVDGSGASEGPARATAEEILALGGAAVPDTNSVATPEGGAAIVDTALAAFGRVDVVVNNAGILRDKTFQNMTPEQLEPVLDVHLRGAFNVTRPAWLHMREQRYGRILLTASNAGAAKMGLVGLARVLAQEGMRYGIQVNALAPIARTRMTEELLGPAGAKLDPRLVAPVAAFLVHEDCPVSGEIYSTGGGRVARFFVGLTPGYFNPDLSAEDVRDHFEEIRSEAGYTVPGGVADEIAGLVQQLQ